MPKTSSPSAVSKKSQQQQHYTFITKKHDTVQKNLDKRIDAAREAKATIRKKKEHLDSTWTTFLRHSATRKIFINMRNLGNSPSEISNWESEFVDHLKELTRLVDEAHAIYSRSLEKKEDEEGKLSEAQNAIAEFKHTVMTKLGEVVKQNAFQMSPSSTSNIHYLVSNTPFQCYS